MREKNFDLAPSLMCANLNNLWEDIRQLEKSEINRLHFDVMDGHLVNNTGLRPGLFEELAKKTKATLEVHLLVEKPGEAVDSFLLRKKDFIIPHIECTNNGNLKSFFRGVRSSGCRTGLALTPHTKIEKILPLLPDLDMLLMMGVEPGFRGRKLLPTAYDRLKKVRNMIEKEKLGCLVEADGGVTLGTAPKLINSGANVIVCGAVIFDTGTCISDSVAYLQRKILGAKRK